MMYQADTDFQEKADRKNRQGMLYSLGIKGVMNPWYTFFNHRITYRLKLFCCRKVMAVTGHGFSIKKFDNNAYNMIFVILNHFNSYVIDWS